MAIRTYKRITQITPQEYAIVLVNRAYGGGVAAAIVSNLGLTKGAFANIARKANKFGLAIFQQDIKAEVF